MKQRKGSWVLCREGRAWHLRTSLPLGIFFFFCMFQLRNSPISTHSLWALDNSHKINSVSVFFLKPLHIWPHLLLLAGVVCASTRWNQGGSTQILGTEIKLLTIMVNLSKMIYRRGDVDLLGCCRQWVQSHTCQSTKHSSTCTSVQFSCVEDEWLYCRNGLQRNMNSSFLMLNWSNQLKAC